MGRMKRGDVVVSRFDLIHSPGNSPGQQCGKGGRNVLGRNVLSKNVLSKNVLRTHIASLVLCTACTVLVLVLTLGGEPRLFAAVSVGHELAEQEQRVQQLSVQEQKEIGQLVLEQAVHEPVEIIRDMGCSPCVCRIKRRLVLRSRLCHSARPYAADGSFQAFRPRPLG